jgi:hypothetical protein
LEGGPSLAILAAYPPAQFQHLLRTGEPVGGRDLGIMSQVAREALYLFTDDEIADLYTFLRTYHGLDAGASARGVSSTFSDVTVAVFVLSGVPA